MASFNLSFVLICAKIMVLVRNIHILEDIDNNCLKMLTCVKHSSTNIILFETNLPIFSYTFPKRFLNFYDNFQELEIHCFHVISCYVPHRIMLTCTMARFAYSRLMRDSRIHSTQFCNSVLYCRV